MHDRARESRPGGGDQTRAAIVSDGDLDSPRVAPVCAQGRHDDAPACPLHGCSSCAIETFGYIDPEDYEPPVPREDPLWDVLADLAETYVDVRGCLICDEIDVRAGWEAFPGWECEDTCTVAHCSSCGVCGRNGRVCSECELCIDHQEDDGGSSCEVTAWAAAVGEQRVIGYRHRLLDPRTGRWGQ